MLDNKDNKLRHKNKQQSTNDLENLASKLSEEERKIITDLLNNDPLSNSYKKCLTIFLIVAITLLLWPLNLNFSTLNNGAAWIVASNGINFLKPGIIISDSPAKPLYDQMTAGSGFTLEARVAAEHTNQTGPARIISYSLDYSNRNFTLAQSHQKLSMRLRTSITDNNGVYPHMSVTNVFSTPTPQHITITYDFSIQRVYVNGKIRAEKSIPGGDFSNWDSTHYLALGNEVTGKRPWAGSIFYVSLYNRALEPDEVRQNFAVVTSEKPDSQKKADLVSSGLVARYFFDEEGGNIIKDSSEGLQPLNLHLTKKINPLKNQFLGTSSSEFAKLSDTCLNVIIFIPLGFLLSGVLQKKYPAPTITFFIVVTAGTLFTLSIESAQYFIGRTSSLIDVLNNILGTIAGITLFRSWKKLLVSQSKQFGVMHLFRQC